LIAIQHSQGTPLGFGSEPFQNDIPTTPWARNADRERVEHHGIPPQKVNGVSVNRHPKIGYDLLASMRFTAIHGYPPTQKISKAHQQLGLGLCFPEELYKLIKFRASTAILSERAPFDTGHL